MWEWFFEISKWASLTIDGVRRCVLPSEFKAWSEITGNDVRPHEFKILHDMDVEFCEEINKEMEAFRERKREEYSKEKR